MALLVSRRTEYIKYIIFRDYNQCFGTSSGPGQVPSSTTAPGPTRAVRRVVSCGDQEFCRWNSPGKWRSRRRSAGHGDRTTRCGVLLRAAGLNRRRGPLSSAILDRPPPRSRLDDASLVRGRLSAGPDGSSASVAKVFSIIVTKISVISGLARESTGASLGYRTTQRRGSAAGNAGRSSPDIGRSRRDVSPGLGADSAVIVNTHYGGAGTGRHEKRVGDRRGGNGQL